MPRRTIQFAKGNYYHTYNQGARRVSIFREPRNYVYVTQLMHQVAEQCHLTVLAYCFLPNHYHWLVRQDGDTPASMLPRQVFGSYTQAYNRAYRERGTLFRGEYGARLIDSDAYLQHLCRYIHANPVKHGIVSSLEAWPYSNYLEWIGSSKSRSDKQEFVHTHFGTAGGYATYLREYLAGISFR